MMALYDPEMGAQLEANGMSGMKRDPTRGMDNETFRQS